MKLLIPKVGARIVLSQPWTFKLSDEYRNESFWMDCHGKPNKKVYYYDPNNYYSGQRSPTPTAVCTRQGHDSADPIDTTIPAGTALYVESFHLQKGHEPKITFRIKKDNKTKIPSGKFQAHIDDINKMELDVEIGSKYPHGRFCIYISENIDYDKCKCGNRYRSGCTCNLPKELDKVIIWESEPDCGSRNNKRLRTEHTTDTAGLDKITSTTGSSRYRYYERRSDYSKTFDNLMTCLTWANKKGFTQSHVDAFLKAYEPLRIEWEKTKA